MDDTLDSLKIENPPITLREMALERMRNAIIAGLFPSGQRLVERTLCEQLGVSRSVIREVIRHLDAEGLVEMLPKQGPIVARLDWNHARQIYDIRASLESSAVESCARNANEETKAQLLELLNALDQNAQRNEPTTILDATTKFYEIIFKSGGHDIAWEIVQRLNSRISRLRVMTLSTAERSKKGPARLREIYLAIDRNAAEDAGKACREHIAEAAKLAEALLRPELSEASKIA